MSGVLVWILWGKGGGVVCVCHSLATCAMSLHTQKTRQFHVYLYHLFFANHKNMLIRESLQGTHKHWKHFKVRDQICENPGK